MLTQGCDYWDMAVWTSEHGRLLVSLVGTEHNADLAMVQTAAGPYHGSSHCRLNWVWNHLWDRPQAVSVELFPGIN